MAIRITCINKDGGYHDNPYVAITRLGWLEESTGKTGYITREQLYDWLKNEGGQAYVLAGNARAEVIPALSAAGTKYVKTRADSTNRDNLLKLPECR